MNGSPPCAMPALSERKPTNSYVRRADQRLDPAKSWQEKIPRDQKSAFACLPPPTIQLGRRHSGGKRFAVDVLAHKGALIRNLTPLICGMRFWCLNCLSGLQRARSRKDQTQEKTGRKCKRHRASWPPSSIRPKASNWQGYASKPSRADALGCKNFLYVAALTKIDDT